MRKRDFFIIIIKLFGLFSAIATVFSALPGNLYFAFNDFDLWAIIWIIIVVSFVFGVFILLIFNSGKLVDLLRLDKGFDSDKLDFGNLNAEEIVKVGVFIIGGLLIIDNIPTFLIQTYYAFKERAIGNLFVQGNKFYWVMSGINILLGYLLVTNFSFVARLFRVANKENEQEPISET